MQRQHSSYVTEQEYLDLERQSEGRHEYWQGEIYAMAGASRRHTLIAANVIACLHAQLNGSPCSVHTGDLRVKVTPTGLYTYPDVAILCGRPEYDDPVQDTALIEHRTRQEDDRWILSIYQGLDTVVTLPSLGCELALADGYEKVDWPSEDAVRGWLRFVKEQGETYLT